MLGAAASPIDKLRKHSTLPSVTSEKPTLFFIVPDVFILTINYQLTAMSYQLLFYQLLVSRLFG